MEGISKLKGSAAGISDTELLSPIGPLPCTLGLSESGVPACAQQVFSCPALKLPAHSSVGACAWFVYAEAVPRWDVHPSMGHSLCPC